MAVVVGMVADMAVVIENNTEITMRLVTASLRLLAMVLLRVDLQEVSLLQVLPIRMLPVSFPLPHSAWMYVNDVADGGYQAYLAMWYQAVAAQQAQGGGDPSKPPGTS